MLHFFLDDTLRSLSDWVSVTQWNPNPVKLFAKAAGLCALCKAMFKRFGASLRWMNDTQDTAVSSLTVGRRKFHSNSDRTDRKQCAERLVLHSISRTHDCHLVRSMRVIRNLKQDNFVNV